MGRVHYAFRPLLVQVGSIFIRIYCWKVSDRHFHWISQENLRGKVLDRHFHWISQGKLKGYLYSQGKLGYGTELAKVSTAEEEQTQVYSLASPYLYHLLRLELEVGERGRPHTGRNTRNDLRALTCPSSKNTAQGQRPFRCLENSKRCSDESDTIGLLLFCCQIW